MFPLPPSGTYTGLLKRNKRCCLRKRKMRNFVDEKGQVSFRPKKNIVLYRLAKNRLFEFEHKD